MKYLLIALVLFCGCRYVTDAQDTAFNQTKASSLLKKYEWFKNAAAQLDSLNASIKVQQRRIDFIEADRANWNRDDRQNWNQASIEMAGIKAGYNNLAAEYNANMAKINYRFCNVGSLPDGSSDPLPREFAAYKEN